jgi:hypothetical protein
MKRWASATVWCFSIILLMLTCCGVPATIAKSWWNNNIENFKGRPDENVSQSVFESRDRGVLVMELEPLPSEFEGPEGKVYIREAWIEERAQSGHKLVWLPHEKRVGGLRLLIKVNNERSFDLAGTMFFRSDDPIGLLRRDRGAASIELDDSDTSNIRLKARQNFDRDPKIEIRFEPKQR